MVSYFLRDLFYQNFCIYEKFCLKERNNKKLIQKMHE